MTTDELQDAADQLREILDVYDWFVDGWPYENDSLSEEIKEHLAKWNPDTVESAEQTGSALAREVTEWYHRVREAEAVYVQRTRESRRCDWSRIVSETEPIREVAQKVHTAGYESNPETGDPGYLLPPDLCPAHLVSMNAGSSPIIYEDRVAQYRAVADRFNLSPDHVYYPGSGHDVSPSESFPASRVVYVDVDVAAMTNLEITGYEAVRADVTGYELEDSADVILFRNAGLIEERVVEANLQSGGWVLANDHLESASHLMQIESLELVGIVPDEWMGDAPPVATANPDGSLSQTELTGEMSIASFKKGSPLDLYVFRDNR